MTVYFRTTMDPDQLTAAARLKIRDLEPNLLVYNMRTTDVQIKNSLSTEGTIASLSAVFGVLATLLAIIGLYRSCPTSWRSALARLAYAWLSVPIMER
jgi:hypothetical protein